MTTAATRARSFLTIVGLAYIGLGIWCALAPENTSKAVGFALQRGQGQAEFLTVDGGLQVALGILFLWPLYKKEEIAFPLAACLVVHACLVLFRTLGFFVFSDFELATYGLAALEWVIILLKAFIVLLVQATASS